MILTATPPRTTAQPLFGVLLGAVLAQLPTGQHFAAAPGALGGLLYAAQVRGLVVTERALRTAVTEELTVRHAVRVTRLAPLACSPALLAVAFDGVPLTLRTAGDPVDLLPWRAVTQIQTQTLAALSVVVRRMLEVTSDLAQHSSPARWLGHKLAVGRVVHDLRDLYAYVQEWDALDSALYTRVLAANLLLCDRALQQAWQRVQTQQW